VLLGGVPITNHAQGHDALEDLEQPVLLRASCTLAIGRRTARHAEERQRDHGVKTQNQERHQRQPGVDAEEDDPAHTDGSHADDDGGPVHLQQLPEAVERLKPLHHLTCREAVEEGEWEPEQVCHELVE